VIDPDHRTDSRKHLDEQIAAEPPLPEPDVTGRAPMPLEAHLARARRLVATFGVVERGMVRPLNPMVTLREGTRVIIIAQDTV
jgi:hypothetical protein